MLEKAAALFSEHYGVWGKMAQEKSGPRIHMSKKRLRATCLPANAVEQCIYVRAFVGDKLAGNVFACEWDVEGRTVLWVTQLVVDSSLRSRHIATRLLKELRYEGVQAYGIMSSHAHACMAAVRALGETMDNVKLELIQRHAATILNASPIPYIKNAKLHGSLFDNAHDGVVSSGYTVFYVDHTEPSWALRSVREKGVAWPFGELAEGHEFLVIVKPLSRLQPDGQMSADF